MAPATAHRLRRAGIRLLPVTGAAGLVVVWWLGVVWSGTQIVPTPAAVVRALARLAVHGGLLRHIVASLFRVTWGFLLAAVVAIPAGLALGWYRRAGRALDPLVQLFRPISPLAWIPIAILFFGLGDSSAIFVIFLGCFFPLLVSAEHAVHSVPQVYLQAGRNFGLSTPGLFRRVLWPAALPHLVVGVRVTLGIAWLVVVAAEMIAVDSGLGFLIIDARNAGNRYDVIVAGMVLIGVIGLALDAGLQQVQRSVRARSAQPAVAAAAAPWLNRRRVVR